MGMDFCDDELNKIPVHSGVEAALMDDKHWLMMDVSVGRFVSPALCHWGVVDSPEESWNGGRCGHSVLKWWGMWPQCLTLPPGIKYWGISSCRGWRRVLLHPSYLPHRSSSSMAIQHLWKWYHAYGYDIHPHSSLCVGSSLICCRRLSQRSFVHRYIILNWRKGLSDPLC